MSNLHVYEKPNKKVLNFYKIGLQKFKFKFKGKLKCTRNYRNI